MTEFEEASKRQSVVTKFAGLDRSEVGIVPLRKRQAVNKPDRTARFDLLISLLYTVAARALSSLRRFSKM